MCNAKTPTALTSRWWAGLVAAAVLTAGCAADNQLPVTVVYQAQQCGDQPPGLSRLRDSEALAAIVGASGVISTDGEPATPLPRVDANSQLLLLISRGQRPTAGYAVRLQSGQASVQDGTLTLSLDFSSPRPDTRVAQVLTSPCLVVSVPPGNYDRVVAGPYELALPDFP